MKKLNSEILIIGGGLIGLVTAYSLALLGFKIIVVEKTSNRKRSKINKKSFKDTRTTAISEGSRQFLEKINLWESLSSCAQQIKFINVFALLDSVIIKFFKIFSALSNLERCIVSTKLK